MHSALCENVQFTVQLTGYFMTMLHEFLSRNHQLLIQRCREKVAKRFEPTESALAIDNGVSLFLEQLTETLAAEQLTAIRAGDSEPSPAPTAGRLRALDG
jgi:hypothetical protein